MTVDDERPPEDLLEPDDGGPDGDAERDDEGIGMDEHFGLTPPG